MWPLHRWSARGPPAEWLDEAYAVQDGSFYCTRHERLPTPGERGSDYLAGVSLTVLDGPV